jgi:hypothetical protein
MQSLSIDHFPRKMQISASRRAKFYELGKGKAKKLAKKWQDESKYQWQPFTVQRLGVKSQRFFLVDIATGEKVIANPKAMGTPNIMTIGGQAIANGSIHPNVRNKMFQELKDFFLKEFKKNKLQKFTTDQFPLMIEGQLFMPYYEKMGAEWDVDNMQLPYLKPFHDALVLGGYIPEDHRAYICKPLGFEYIPSDKYHMKINFKTNKNPIWKRTYERFKVTL